MKHTHNKLNHQAALIHLNRPAFNIRQQGFSLIEFMVASAIGVIVLMAAGATYFTTVKLKQDVESKVAYQQNMRNTADLLRRDIRQAGNFGCMTEPTTAVLGGSISTDNKFLSQAALPSAIAPSDTIGSPLVTIYGHNTNNQNANDCGQTVDNQNMIDGAAYVVAKMGRDAHYNLYRFVYSQGAWVTTPQMVAENVSNLALNLQYQDSTKCPTSTTDTAKRMGMTTSPVSGQLPILVATTLTTCPSGKYSGGSCSEGAQSYVVQAMLRQGNLCLKKINELTTG